MFVSGAVFVEIVSYGELREIANQRSYLIQVVIEETIELVGISTILVGAIKTCFGHLFLTWPLESSKFTHIQTQTLS